MTTRLALILNPLPFIIQTLCLGFVSSSPLLLCIFFQPVKRLNRLGFGLTSIHAGDEVSATYNWDGDGVNGPSFKKLGCSIFFGFRLILRSNPWSPLGLSFIGQNSNFMMLFICKCKFCQSIRPAGSDWIWGINEKQQCFKNNRIVASPTVNRFILLRKLSAIYSICGVLNKIPLIGKWATGRCQLGL